MGLGKTIQVIYTMKVNKVPNTIIIVPNSLVSQWESELKKFDVSATITTYSKFVKENEYMSKYWDRVVLDEAHDIRTQSSKRFQNICKIPSRIRWVITGTPVYNKESDYRSLKNFVLQKRVCIARRDILLRRTKDDVGYELPQLHVDIVELEMNKDEWSEYTEYFEECTEKSLDGFKYLSALLKLRQLSIHPRLCNTTYAGRSNKIDEMIRDIKRHPCEKSIIFCQFHKEMDIITEELVGYTVLRLDGNVPTDERQDMVDFFNESRRKSGKPFDEMCPAPVFIIQIKTGGQGLNLQQATRIYITSPAWNPATELQAIARAHRTGQTRDVYVKKYIYTSLSADVNSFDEAVILLHNDKNNVCADILDDVRIKSQIPVNLKNIAAQAIRKIFSRSIINDVR
jgi:SNF2 family DNA or RNA helicase